jgi:hypothetical protein
MLILQEAGEERAGGIVVGPACEGPELAGIGFGAIACQGIDGEEDERGDRAGREDANLGQEVAGDGEASE